MRQVSAAHVAARCLWFGIGLLALTRGAQAQAGQQGTSTWNDPRSRALVELATRRRAVQFADTGLLDYQATANGYLTFMMQMGVGFVEVPKIVKTDELALEVYWHAPNLSKQRIIGRRDTLLLPTDIRYHSDHLGIFQNNFPDIIRIGDGDEVRDVPHPLSPSGLGLYDFAITDSLTIRLGDRDIHVTEVTVRPKDDNKPRIVGALYIDPSEGQVVRMAFNFTHAALLDQTLEDLSVVLENRLISGRYWLPSHQEVEIHRTEPVFDFPIRMIIRGEWKIGDYQFNLDMPRPLFSGPEIVSVPPSELAKYPWHGGILDSLPPDLRETADPDVKRVEEQARELVRAQALARADRFVITAPSISEFARVNRVEGLAPGFGLSHGLGSGVSALALGRFGLDDHTAQGSGMLRWETPSGSGLRIFALHDFRDVSDTPERSTILNSLAAQEFGSDDTDPYSVHGYGLTATKRASSSLVVTGEGTYEREDPLAVHATPASGRYLPTLAIEPMDAVRLSLRLDRAATPWIGSTTLSLASEARSLIPTRDLGTSGVATKADLRFSLSGEVTLPAGRTEFVSRTMMAAVTAFGDDVVPQERVFLGGPTSGPGYGFHSFMGTSGLSERLEMHTPMPFPSFSLGRFGRTPTTATFAPFVNLVALGGASACADPRSAQPLSPVVPPRCFPGQSGLSPSVGIGVLSFYDLLRVDVARGFHDGRWTFNVDVNREFWKIL